MQSIPKLHSGITYSFWYKYNCDINIFTLVILIWLTCNVLSKEIVQHGKLTLDNTKCLKISFGNVPKLDRYFS